MTPRALMITGAVGGVAWAAVSLFVDDAFPFVGAAFMSGALFGKGYGVWEGRGKRPCGNNVDKAP